MAAHELRPKMEAYWLSTNKGEDSEYLEVQGLIASQTYLQEFEIKSVNSSGGLVSVLLTNNIKNE